MSMKEIDNENTTKSNATRDNVYTIRTTQIHAKKYIEYDPSKPTQPQTTNSCDRVLETQKPEPSASRMFVKLIVLVYKRARQSGRQSVRIQSTLCEVVVVVRRSPL